MAYADSTPPNVRLSGQHWAVRFGAALLATAVALWIWFLWPVMHEDPFAIFIAAVIVTARFFGFGPALLCTGSSVAALAYFVFPPTGFEVGPKDSERLLVFVLVAILTAGLARQRSRAETRAGEMRQRMAAIVESSEDAILSTTSEGIITSWNRGAETLYGYTADEAIGRHVSFVAPPERSNEVAHNTARLKQGEYVDSYQTERLRKDGSRVNVLLSISPLRNSSGAIVGSSAIARDISAQRRAEEALRRNEKLATAGRLAATIAHEINNPLEAVTNLLYLARHDHSRQDEYLAQAEKELQRVAAIAQQTLGFVRESPAAPLSIAETFDQVLQLYGRKLEEKHIETEKEYDAEVEIRGFAGELRQLFSNLILNAIDAMDDHGKLRLRVARTHLWSNGLQPGVRVTVADNGSGISPADMLHIFEPFYTTKKDIGTGLGLWLAHGIVQKHGGSIRVRSRTTPGNSGTVFSIFLPERAETERVS
ncbi:MAG: PAS domain S-box protein [Acidobacteriia bacterium]|nr:PAS domain S-box protein [Terriglobia bacterium]